jgi:catechol 2,3-dioxygenase-like lactoylglutathione lyase family enzyme
MVTIKETNVTIMVRDMDKSIQFYESIGLTLKNRWDNHYAMMVTTGLTIGIHPGGENYQGSGNISIGFMTDEISEAKALLQKFNIGYKHDDGKSGNYLNFTDPDGTLLYFVQPKW